MAAEHPVFGALPPNWEVKTIGELASKVGSGATPRGGKRAYVDEGVALIRSQNVQDLAFTAVGLARITDEAAERLKGVTVAEDDVLLNITGASIARCVTAPAWVLPARVNQHVAIIRCGQMHTQRYLMYVLNHPRMKAHILSHNAGGSREAITKAHIESFCVPVPPDDERRAIAEVLGSLDQRVEWCVEAERGIDAVLTAEAERQPGSVPLASVASFVKKSISASAVAKVDSWFHYSLPSYDDEELARSEQGSSIKSGKFAVPAESVLISKLNPHTPRVWAPLDDPTGRSICSTEFLPFVPQQSVSRGLLYGILRSNVVTRQMTEVVGGGTASHQRVRPGDVECIRVPALESVPTHAREVSDLLLQRRLATTEERVTLMSLRESLLPRLVSGDLRVSDLDAVLAEVG